MSNMASMTYDFFRDMGSLIAGILALVAGIMAYCAGLVQAKATRDAAAGQIAATNRTSTDQVAELSRQLNHAIDLEDARQLATRRGLLHALAMEASRINMVVQQLRPSPFAQGVDIGSRVAVAKALAINPTVEVRHNPDLDALVSGDTASAARTVVARLDQLNTQLLLKAIAGDFRGDGEIADRLTAVKVAADKLEAAVALDLARDE